MRRAWRSRVKEPNNTVVIGFGELAAVDYMLDVLSTLSVIIGSWYSRGCIKSITYYVDIEYYVDIRLVY